MKEKTEKSATKAYLESVSNTDGNIINVYYHVYKNDRTYKKTIKLTHSTNTSIVMKNINRLESIEKEEDFYCWD